MKKIMIVLMLFVCMNPAMADICTVMGEIFLEDGTPAPRGSIVNVTDVNMSVSYLTSTGGTDWPKENFYVRTFTCDFYDMTRIEIGGTVEEFIFDEYPYESYLTADIKKIKIKEIDYSDPATTEKEPKTDMPRLVTTGEYMHDVMRPEEETIESYLIFFVALSVILVAVTFYTLYLKKR